MRAASMSLWAMGTHVGLYLKNERKQNSCTKFIHCKYVNLFDEIKIYYYYTCYAMGQVDRVIKYDIT